MERVDRPIEEKTRVEIEHKLKSMGDFVKMSYLQRALKSGLDFDSKKFVLLRLAGIYEGRRMHQEAARLVKIAAEINTTYKDKIKEYMKSVELYIKGGIYNEADQIFAQCLALCNSREKQEVKGNFKEYYLTQAKIFVNADKRVNAKLIYEKILSLDLGVDERREVQMQLLSLYDRLGNVKEYYRLKESM